MAGRDKEAGRASPFREIKNMSRTNKDKNKNNYKSQMRLGRKMKLAAKQKKKTLKDETNPRIYKLKSANTWDFT